MTTRLSHGAFGAIRRFAGWVARGSVGYPLFSAGRPADRQEVDDYRNVLADEPSAMETLFAVFVNNLELDASGEPTNEKFSERRAAVFLHQYVTRTPPADEPPIGPDECELY